LLLSIIQQYIASAGEIWGERIGSKNLISYYAKQYYSLIGTYLSIITYRMYRLHIIIFSTQLGVIWAGGKITNKR